MELIKYENTYECEDYAASFENFYLSLAMENLFNVEMRCVEEFVTLRNALQNGKLVLEDVTVSNDNAKSNDGNANNPNQGFASKVWNSIKNMITKFINFIKGIISKFTDKVNDLIGNNNDWLVKNAKVVDAIQDNFWNDCTVTIYPYFFKHPVDIFNRNVFDAQSIGFVKVDNKSSLQTAISKISADGSNIAEVCANKIAKFKKESFAEGCKYYYRGISDTTTAFTGTGSKEICQKLRDYALNYKSVYNEISKDVKEIIKILEGFEKAIKEGNYKALQESDCFISSTDMRLYSVLENDYLYNVSRFDDIALESADGTEMMIVVEADGDGQAQQQGQGETTSTNGKADVTNDNVVDGKITTDQNAVNYARTKVKVYRLLSDALTARMTIAEEAYLAAIRTLKTVVRTAQRRGDVNMNSIAKTAEDIKHANDVQDAGQNKSAKDIVDQTTNGDGRKALNKNKNNS